MEHVTLGTLAPSSAPIRRSTPTSANVVPGTVPYTPFGAPMGLTPEVPAAEMGKGKSCVRKRMGKAGTRCFCGGKMVKSSRC